MQILHAKKKKRESHGHKRAQTRKCHQTILRDVQWHHYNQKRFVFFIIRRNSSSLTSPSPSRSASSIISCNSSSVIRSPSSFATRFRFLKEILPVSSSSKSRKAFKISSLGSRFRILCVIILRNSSYPMVPLPSSSTSEIIF